MGSPESEPHDFIMASPTPSMFWVRLQPRWELAPPNPRPWFWNQKRAICPLRVGGEVLVSLGLVHKRGKDGGWGWSVQLLQLRRRGTGPSWWRKSLDTKWSSVYDAAPATRFWIKTRRDKMQVCRLRFKSTLREADVLLPFLRCPRPSLNLDLR